MDPPQGTSNSGASKEVSNSPAILHHVTPKLPAFPPNNAAVWFEIAEAQFALCRITDSTTKFYHALAALPPDVVAAVPKSIRNAAKYEPFKEKIESLYEATHAEVFDRLLTDTQLNGKPSQILQTLQTLAQRVEVSDDIIRHRFLQCLPENMRGILTVAGKRAETLDELAAIGDEVFSYVQKPLINATVPEIFPGLAAVHQRSQRASNASSAGYLGLTPYSPGQRPKICRCHIFFADNARSCKTWCQYPNKQQGLRMEPNSRANSRPGSPVRFGNSRSNSPTRAGYSNSSQNPGNKQGN